MTLATGAISVTTANDAITFNHTIDGGQALTLVSGTAATTISGDIGAGTALTGLTITNGTANGTITFGGNIGDGSGAGVTGVTAVGNTNTADLNFNSTIYSFDGATTITAASGDTIDIAAGAATTFTTDADNITFATGNIELVDGSNLTVDTGAAGGNITCLLYTSDAADE